jgi:phenylacetate-coenzyme A ligase PaaK-like adenylate-forming protein
LEQLFFQLEQEVLKGKLNSMMDLGSTAIACIPSYMLYIAEVAGKNGGLNKRGRSTQNWNTRS